MADHDLHERALAVVDRVLRRYVGNGSLARADADDVRSTVALRVLTRLDEDPGSFDNVRSFEDFVAAIAHNAIRDLFRQRHPERARRRKLLQTILRDDPRFVTVREANVTWCALRGVEHEPRVERPAMSADFSAAAPRRASDAIALMLERAGGPVPFDALAEAAAPLWGAVHDGADLPLPEAHPDPAPDAGTRFIARETLLLHWKTLLELPQHQRAALLLHLRDDRGESAVPLFVFTGIATLEEIAAALGIERPRLEAMLDDLPLPDLEIAKLLRTTRSTVIGYRKSARERLARALRRAGGKS